MKLYKIAFRNIKRNTRRSILSGIAIAISAMVITILFSLYAGIGVDLKTNVFNVVTGHIRIRHLEYGDNEILNPLHLGVDDYPKVLSSLDKMDEIAAVNPRIQFATAVFGSYRLFVDDIKDWSEFLKRLKAGRGPVFSFLKEKYLYVWQRLASRQTFLPALNNVNESSDNLIKGELLFGINEALSRYVLYSPQRFSGISLSKKAIAFTKRKYSFEEISYFNRLLLEDVVPELIKESPRAGKMVTGRGMALDFKRDKDFMDLESYGLKGSLPKKSNGIPEVILSAGFARKLHATVGDIITITSKTRYMGINGMSLKVTGIAKLPMAMYNSSYFFLPLATGQKLLKMDGSISEILVLLKNENKLKSAISRINSTLADASITNLEVRAWDTIGINPVYIMLLNFVGYYMGLFFFLLGSTVIITTTMMVVYERIREIGTVAAMGMTSSQIVRLFFIEAFFIGAIASFVGVVIGSGISIGLGIFGMDWTEELGEVDMAFNSILKPSWSIVTATIIFLYSTFIASAASYFPSRRAAKIEPVEALRAV